ncbi:MAG: hypothetical protein KGJ87_09400 [Planctomycetota bacterium]|nr:hypothetical protein [Planctomycetota bacterium]
MKNIFVKLFIIAVFLGINFNCLHAQEQPQIQEPTETGQELTLAGQPLEIWTFINDYRVITGKTLHLTVQVMWKLGVTVNLEGVEKIDLSPFRVEGVTIGERQIFDNEHDYIVITYALSLPSDLKEGIYSIPSFSLPYKNEVNQTEGKATSAPVAIKKVPIMVEGKVDRDVVTIGDRIKYTLTVRHERNIKLLWENIEKLNFPPFEIAKKVVEKQTEGNIEKVAINYTLSLYELGGKKKTPEIPSVTILYYREPDSQSSAAKADTSHIETKEVKTVPIPIIINSLLKAVDVPLEGIKGPMYYSKKDIFLKGYLMMGIGIVLLFFLGMAVLRPLAGRLTTASSKPTGKTPKISLERLKNITTSFKFTNEDPVNRKNIHDINKALRIYLGIIIGISTETAQSATTASFLNYDSQKQLSEETLTITAKALKQLDTLIFGKHIKKETVDSVMQKIEEIIKLTSPKLA